MRKSIPKKLHNGTKSLYTIVSCWHDHLTVSTSIVMYAMTRHAVGNPNWISHKAIKTVKPRSGACSSRRILSKY
jgi:hypothetical protein